MFGSNQEERLQKFSRDERNEAISLGLTYSTLFVNKAFNLS